MANYVVRFKDYKPSGRTVNGKRVAIGIDLDGCVDNGMEKHLLAFGTASIKHFGLQMIQGYAMDAWMYVNCYSKTAGVTRFKSVYMWTDILRNSPIVKDMNIELPELKYLRKWADITDKFSPEALYEYLVKGDFGSVLKAGDREEDAFKELHDILNWSNEVNALVPSASENIVAFPNAVKVIKRAYEMGADLAIASGTPEQHVKTMVERYGIDNCLQGLFAQQAGKKNETLVTMMVGPVDDTATEPLLYNHQAQYGVLMMIGDAPKDYKELQKANKRLSGDENVPGRMFMVKVGSQNDSWSLLYQALDDIVKGRWNPRIEKHLIDEAHDNLDRSFPYDHPINRFPINKE
jgi:phosphoglycolate phosphatase-like HAD superfamily hydrolase